MQTTYRTHLDALHQWISEINSYLRQNINFIITPSIEANVLNGIQCIANCIDLDYPFYSAQLYSISSQLFIRNQPPRFQPNPTLNVMMFSELSVIERHLYSEPINIQFFSKIHPRIQRISGPLYADGHFPSAAEKAMKEVESRLRELFLELKPGASPPPNAAGLIGALLSEKGVYTFANDTTTSDRNYRRGIQSLFEGAFAAYRNPASHDNLYISQREALEQIFLASQMMYVLESGAPTTANGQQSS